MSTYYIEAVQKFTDTDKSWSFIGLFCLKKQVYLLNLTNGLQWYLRGLEKPVNRTEHLFEVAENMAMPPKTQVVPNESTSISQEAYK